MTPRKPPRTRVAGAASAKIAVDPLSRPKHRSVSPKADFPRPFHGRHRFYSAGLAPPNSPAPVPVGRRFCRSLPRRRPRRYQILSEAKSSRPAQPTAGALKNPEVGSGGQSGRSSTSRPDRVKQSFRPKPARSQFGIRCVKSARQCCDRKRHDADFSKGRTRVAKAAWQQPARSDQILATVFSRTRGWISVCASTLVWARKRSMMPRTNGRMPADVTKTGASPSRPA
jgi:hypothetical protein